MKKRLLSVLLAAGMIASLLVGCTTETVDNTSGNTVTEVVDNSGSGSTDAGTTATAGGQKVGVSMPTKTLQRWNQDGDNMKKQLEAAGYEVDLEYAADDVNTQISQIQNMIADGCSVLVIAAINGESLGTVLAEAQANNIPVIAYDRLIMNSDAVTYYATFDNYMVGKKQGQYIEEKLGLKDGKSGFNIEIFAGDPGDNNATFFYNGAMDVIKPYIDNGQVTVVSGAVEFEKVATEGWKTEKAQSRMDDILASFYGDGTKLDAVLCSNDSTAQGVTNALIAGYKGDYPIITGQDCDIVSVKNMIAGKQAMSIFKDTRDLAAKTVEMVDAILKGGEAPINNEETYNNGVKIVPSYLCEPVFADINNYKELLIDSGYYTEADLE